MMRDKIKEMLECAGAVASFVILITLFWAILGIYGISEGSTDACTESFKTAVETVVRFIATKMTT